MPEGEQKLVKHRKLVVRNTLTELEAGVIFLRKAGWDFDPDNKTESLMEAMETVLIKKMPIGIGMFKMGPPIKPGETFE